MVLRAAFISLTSAFSSDVIRSCKWQLLAWSRIHQGGVACWPSPPPLLLLPLIGNTHGSPSGQWLTKWWISSPILACWSIVTPTFAPTERVDIGICHSGSCAPESHNCWLVKWVLALWNNYCVTLGSFLCGWSNDTEVSVVVELGQQGPGTLWGWRLKPDQCYCEPGLTSACLCVAALGLREGLSDIGSSI